MLVNALLGALILLLGPACVDAAPGSRLRTRSADEPGIEPKILHIPEDADPAVAFHDDGVDPTPLLIPFDRPEIPFANFTSLPPVKGKGAAAGGGAPSSPSSPAKGNDSTVAWAAHPRDINGADDRKLYTGGAQLPYSAMGRLLARNGVTCSAALVGPRHVVSARHCYQPGVALRFQPLYDQGEYLTGAFVTTVIKKEGEIVLMCDHQDDWVVFILDQPIGKDRGWLGFRTLDSDIAGKQVFYNFGYPSDLSGGERPYTQGPFAANTQPVLQCPNGGPLTSDMDAASGQSGGPLWVNMPDGAYQVGIHSASQPGFSVAAQGREWFDAVSYARAQYP